MAKKTGDDAMRSCMAAALFLLVLLFGVPWLQYAPREEKPIEETPAAPHTPTL